VCMGRVPSVGSPSLLIDKKTSTRCSLTQKVERHMQCVVVQGLARADRPKILWRGAFPKNLNARHACATIGGKTIHTHHLVRSVLDKSGESCDGTISLLLPLT
jgi:hypothetical protein